MNNFFTNILLLFGLAITLCMQSSCSVQRFMKDDPYLFRNAVLEVDKADSIKFSKSLKSSLDEAFVLKPNSSFLGAKIGLYIYYLDRKRGKDKGFFHWLNDKLGEDPVYYNEFQAQQVAKVIKTKMANHGYFDARVRMTTFPDKASHTLQVNYLVEAPNPAYKITSFTLDLEDSTLLTKSILKSMDESLVKEGDEYHLGNLVKERERIAEYLKDNGFYFFNKTFFQYEADSSVNDRTIKLSMNIREDIPLKDLVNYEIRNIKVEPDFDLDGLNVSKDHQKIEYKKGFNYDGDPENIRPNFMWDIFKMKPGQKYSKSFHQSTVKRLTSLGLFKFINMNFDEVEVDSVARSGLLDVNVEMSQVTLRTVSADLIASIWSNGYTGPEINLNWRDRNLKAGGEDFKITGLFGLQKQFGSADNGVDIIYWYGINTSLSIPRVVAPFKINSFDSDYLPRTLFEVNFTHYNFKPAYKINYFTSSYGFNWQKSINKRHTFTPISISLQQTDYSENYDSEDDSFSSLFETYDDQFILGSGYTYEVNSKPDNDSKTTFKFRTDLSVSGNLLYLIQKASNAKVNETGQFTLFNVPYSQYWKTTNEIVTQTKTSKNGTLATRLLVGWGNPWGNSQALPFVKQYFSGGPNSIRAFKTRTIGPGSYNPTVDEQDGENRNEFAERGGDIRLEANIEYRYKVHPYLNLAAFVDAGNVWLLNEDPNRVGGAIKTKNLLDEIALGTGIGLRLDFTFFVFRFDIGYPLKLPYDVYNEEGELQDRWVYDSSKFEDLVLNIALCYPF